MKFRSSIAVYSKHFIGSLFRVSMRFMQLPNFFAHQHGNAAIAEKVFFAILDSPQPWNLLPSFGGFHVFLHSGKQQPEMFEPSFAALSLGQPDVLPPTMSEAIVFVDCGGRSFEQQWLSSLVLAPELERVPCLFLTYCEKRNATHWFSQLAGSNVRWLDIEDDVPLPCREALDQRTIAILRDESSTLFEILAQQECSLSAAGIEKVQQTARIKALWEYWLPRLRPRLVVTRNNWTPLSSTILLSLRDQSSISTATFQHSVAGSWLSYSPPLAQKLFTYGASSANLFAAIQSELEQRFQLHFPCQHFLPVGNFLSPLPTVSPDPTKRSLLVFDQYASWALDYFGIHEELLALHDLVETLAKGDVFHEIRIRLHPDWPGENGFWQDLAQRYPSCVQLSDSNVVSLAEDLAASSLGIGLFSSALPLACCAGLPCFFLSRSGSCFTPELFPFHQRAGTKFVDFSGSAEHLLVDTTAYCDLRDQLQQVASDYFAADTLTARTISLQYCLSRTDFREHNSTSGSGNEKTRVAC